jgi:nucleoside-diphosphate-sugar epimerase
VQLQELVVVRRVGHREAAPRPVLQQELDVLPREELQPLGGRQLQVQHHYVVGEALEALHPHRQRLHLDVLRRADGARLDDDVTERLRLAEERLALRFLLVRQRLLLVDAVVDGAGDDPALAAAAGAVAAAVRQDEVLAQRRRENRLAALDFELLPARLQRDFQGPCSVYNSSMKRLLVAGFGDIARRAEPLLRGRFEVVPLSRRSGRDLDRPQSLVLEAADAVLHLAPPPREGDADTRTANLLAALEKARILPARLVYVSTSGVYGDCGGARVDEGRPAAPATPRARRRADAERRLALWCSAREVALVVLRAPGIYAAERLPLQRLRAALPVLRREDDVYTSHVHADDLAASAARALEDDAPAGVYNCSDDSELLMGDWLDFVADYAGLPRPPRLVRSEASARVSAETYSFMCESRRLDNQRLKRHLGVRLRYATVQAGLGHEHAPGVH